MKRKPNDIVAPAVVQPSAKSPAEIVELNGSRYRVIREPAPRSDTPEFTPVVIGGRTYRMCLEMEELCDAEIALMREGRDVNLLRLFGNFSLRAVRQMFAVSIRYYHPELDFEEACRLVTLPYGVIVGSIIASAFTKDLPSPEPPPDDTPPVESTEAA